MSRRHASGPRDALRGWVRAIAARHAWAPVLVFSVHVVLSRVVLAYGALPWIDAPMHVVGGLTITWFALGAAREAAGRGLIGSPNRAGLLLLAFLADR